MLQGTLPPTMGASLDSFEASSSPYGLGRVPSHHYGFSGGSSLIKRAWGPEMMQSRWLFDRPLTTGNPGRRVPKVNPVSSSPVPSFQLFSTESSA